MIWLFSYRNNIIQFVQSFISSNFLSTKLYRYNKSHDLWYERNTTQRLCFANYAGLGEFKFTYASKWVVTW